MKKKNNILMQTSSKINKYRIYLNTNYTNHQYILSSINKFMQYRFLGPTGIRVSVISYGNWVNSDSKEAEQLTIDCVRTAWEQGINFFDTAERYGYGEAEINIGKALHLLDVPRHKFVLSTKLYWGTAKLIPNTIGLSRKHIIEGLKASLKRLDYEYVDVVFCHRFDPDVPMQEICRAFDWTIRNGLAHYWGTSEWNSENIAEAIYVCQKYGLNGPVVQQPQYNLLMRDNVELTYKKLFEDKKLGSTVWSPLASGILTGKYNDGIPEDSRFGKNPNLANFMNKYFSAAKKEKTIASLRKFQELAIEMDCSMAQLAMAWVISNPDVSTAITGVTRVEQIIQTVKAVQLLPKLTVLIQRRIEEIFQTEPKGKVNTKYFTPQISRRRIILKLE